MNFIFIDDLKHICEGLGKDHMIQFLFHPSQVFLGHSGALDIEGNELPRLVYVSREKRPGYQHHKKAGAENALVITHTLRVIITHVSAIECRLSLNDWLDTGKGVCSSHKCSIHPQS